MAMGNKIGKTFGSTLIVASLLAACNESNFQSETPTRPSKKSSNAVPVVEDPVDVAPTDPGKLPDSLAQLFPASVEKEGKFSFSLDMKNTQTSFQLVETTGAVNDQRTQVDRVQTSNSFTQGTSGKRETQNFTQEGKKGLVDILVVIDNSGSMSDEQEKLGTKMDALISSLNGVDWQIGVVTTSFVKNTCNMTLIKSSQTDAATAFDTAIRAGIKGDGNEQGLKQAAVGLRCETFGSNSPKLVRSNSTVAVLIVSDEDNCSDGIGPSPFNTCKDDAANLESVVTGTLGRTIGQNAGFFGLFTETKATCPSNGQNIVGTKYIDFIKSHTKGNDRNFGDICANSYESTLKRISESIALLLGNDFALKAIPDAGTLEVRENGVLVDPSKFVVSGQTLSFKAPPANNAQIIATYTVGKTLPLPTDTVILGKDPAPETIVVRLTEGNVTKIVSPSSYTVSNRTIKFNSTLPDLSTAEVAYRVKQDLLTKFTLANGNVNASSIKVTVNGAATSAFSYNAATNEVVLNQAPGDGQSIVISYSFVTGQQLTYALPLAVGARDIKILDGASELTFNQNGSNFTIGAGDFVAGKTLVLQYEVPDASDRLFDLPQEPVTGSETLSVASGSCDLNNGIVIAGSKLVANCAVEAKTDFTLTYKFLEVQKVYTINGISDPEKGVFVVSVDGEPTTNYTRVGSSITLNFEPPLDSKVDIRYTFPE